MVFCLAVNTVTYFFGVHCKNLALDFFFFPGFITIEFMADVCLMRQSCQSHYVLKRHFGKYFHLLDFKRHKV